MDQRILQIIQKHPELKSEFEEIYPELNENENERVRKELIEFLNSVWYLGKDTNFDKWEKSDCARWIAWLEKQKEQKSLNISAASEWLRKHVCNYINSEYNEFHHCVEYDGSIDKERLINDFEEAMPKEQKPAEWSKEDEENLQDLCELLMKEDLDFYNLQTREEFITWLKSLRPSWKPSEDEERLINTSISFLKDFADKGYENAVECIDWLKSKSNGNSDK